MKEWESTGSEVTSLNYWSEVLSEIQARIAPRFARAEVRERVGRYLVGLIERVERKNGWQPAEALGEQGPQGVQRLLNAVVWDTEGGRDNLRRYGVDALGDGASGVLIVDETGFLKQGRHSCGVARQYTGTAGTTSNAQVGVFLAYSSVKGTAFVDRVLYLPRHWSKDSERARSRTFPRACALPPRFPWRSGCSPMLSLRGCQRAGLPLIRVMGGRTRSDVAGAARPGLCGDDPQDHCAPVRRAA